MTTSPPMRIGSLCTGYGGLDVAAAAVLGGHLAWVADNNPAAVTLLTHHHPAVPNLGDITAADWGDVEPVDVVTAGYPCQPFSMAGKRGGADDARHLWPHVAQAVRRLRPRLVVLENVAGHRSLGFGRVLGDLASFGYVGSWRSLQASDVGAPHRRERVFILARHTDTHGPRSQGAQPTPPSGVSGRLDGAATNADDLGGHRTGTRPAQAGRPVVARDTAADAPRDGRHQGRTEPAGIVGGPDAALRGGPAPADAQGERHGDAGTAGIGGLETAAVTGASVDWGSYGPAVARWERVTGRVAPAPTEPAPKGGHRLSPRFVEWLMGLDAGHVTDVPGLTRNQQLCLLGNGVVPQQGAAALRLLLAVAADRQGAGHR